jgi:hypothetical protein
MAYGFSVRTDAVDLSNAIEACLYVAGALVTVHCVRVGIGYIFRLVEGDFPGMTVGEAYRDWRSKR